MKNESRINVGSENINAFFTQEEKNYLGFSIFEYYEEDVEKSLLQNSLTIKQPWGTVYYKTLSNEAVNMKDWKDGSFFIVSEKDYNIVGCNFTSVKEAENYIAENYSKEIKISKQHKKHSNDYIR